MRRAISIALLTMALALASVAVAGPAVAQDACQPPSGPADPPAVTGGNGSISALQPGPAPDAAPLQCWTGASGNATLGGRAVALGDLIATMTDLNEVVGFRADGTEVWRAPLADPGHGHLGGLTTDGTLIFAAAPAGLFALDPADGAEVWLAPVQEAAVEGTTGAESPVNVGEAVYVVLNTVGAEEPVDRFLVALDAASGDELWRNALFAKLPAGPVSADESSVALWDGSGTVKVFEPETGASRWAAGIEQLGIAPIGPVTMADELLVTNLAAGLVVALSIDDGSTIWEYLPDAPFTAATTLQNGVLYVNAVTKLVAVDAASGQTLWEAPLQEQPSPFEYRPIPAVADGLVIVGTTNVDTNASLLAFDAADGSERWRTDVSIFGAMLSPIVSGGRIYVPAFDINQQGGLIAFGSG